MAVTQTGAIYKALSFDGVSSRTYGVYITGTAVYNAPARDVEMVTIPGRNGSFALDNGRFENITVSYPAGIFADTEADFAQAISDFRNYLCSRKGYVRLQDDYNPNEYRMAIYKSGLEVTPAQLKAGEFEIVFECKPQRFLTSGEAAVAVASGGKLTNPTYFESNPLLTVEGYGDIEFNGYDINIADVTVGTIEILPKATIAGPATLDYTGAPMNTGDSMTISRLVYTFNVVALGKTITAHASTGYDPGQTNVGTLPSSYNVSASGGKLSVSVVYENLSFSYGNSIEEIETYFKSNVTIGGSSANLCFVIQIRNIGDVNSKALELNAAGYDGTWYPQTRNEKIQMEPMMGVSTVQVSLGTIYIDCDLGDAYKINGTEIISLNQYIDLGSNLPKLAANGATTFNYDNTITTFKVTPRWWKI